MISAGWLNVAWLSISSAVVSFGAPSTRIPQDIDKNLLNFIKHNLRRNNDDYNDQLINVDGTAAPSPVPSSPATPDATLATANSAVPLPTLANIVVLVSASVNRPTPPDPSPPPATTSPHTAKRALDDFDRNDISGLNKRNPNTNSDESEEDDNRGMIQVFLKPKSVQPTPRQLMTSFTPSADTTRPTATPTPRPTTANTQHPTPFPTRRRTSTFTTHVTKTLVKDKPVQRKRFASTKANKPVPGEGMRVRESPRADILDMAPARGSRINAKRSKGRLCQRHVLLPEGPKYNSGGVVYLQAHDSGRPFPRTREPRLLLPACCNCCKKSVLGCE